MYNGINIDNMIVNAPTSVVTSLPTTVTGRYLKSGANYTPAQFFNSFHNATANVNDLKFNINGFRSSGTQIYPTNTCAQMFSYATPGSLNLKTDSNISSPTAYPNRVYFILLGAGGGGGGGGHDAPSTDQNARGGGGGGAGGLNAKLIDTSIGPGVINFTVGTGGAGGTRGFTLSGGGGSRDGGAGATGGNTTLTYNGFTYTASGGSGGGGGIGGDYNGSLANGGTGGTNTSSPGSPPNNPLYDTTATGNTGGRAAPDDTNASSFAAGGTISFPFKNNGTDAYSIPNLGTNRGPGGAGGYGDHAPIPVAAPFPTVTAPYDGRGTDGEAGSTGSVYLFFYFD